MWNASRFVIQNVNFHHTGDHPRGDKFLTIADKKILKELEKLKKETLKHTEKYELGKVLHLLYKFFWHKYADVYIEVAKKQLTDEKLKTNTQKILLKVHTDLLKMLHPFLPFVTEEIWTTFGKLNGSKKLLIIEQWPR